jgi:hypothetical protein
MFLEHLLPVLKEVLIERLILRVVGLYHGSIETSDFF